MNYLRKPWLIFAAVIIILLLWSIGGYNGFVQLQGTVANAWASVQVQEQRRMDLIPNLVSTVKGAANFEKDTFAAVTAARSAWSQAGTLGDRQGQIKAAGTFDAALSRLLVTVEAYPQLQATQAFRDLMTQLEGTENRIAVSRRDYNNAVMAYNVRRKYFPSSLIAFFGGFEEEIPFVADEKAKVVPAIDFSTDSIQK